MYDRKIPGEGELPLRDLLALLPRDLVIGLEIPRRALAEQEIGPRERMAPAFSRGAQPAGLAAARFTRNARIGSGQD